MLVERLRRLLPGLWAGVLLCVALIATPAPFATLLPADAGRVVGRIFVQEAWLSLMVGLLLLIVERRRARDAAEAGRGSVLSTEMLLLFGTLFCTIAGHFGLQPLLPGARAGHGRLSFGQLHAVSVLFFGVKTLLVLALSWRVSSTAPSS
jgi:hypothetical protein